jgi:hypothetical protein
MKTACPLRDLSITAICCMDVYIHHQAGRLKERTWQGPKSSLWSPKSSYRVGGHSQLLFASYVNLTCTSYDRSQPSYAQFILKPYENGYEKQCLASQCHFSSRSEGKKRVGYKKKYKKFHNVSAKF